MSKLVWMFAVATLVGCAGSETETAVGTQAVSTENGIWENGLATNGIWENGIWENGIWENGIWENGIWENGIWENGIWENGIWENGVSINGIWENGIWENGIWENGLWQENPTALDTLRTNPFTRKVMQYVFSCAVPAGRSKIIDPGRTGACSTTTATSCVHDSECPTDEVCLGGELELTGAIGVGINAGAPAANWDLPGGTCDLECQRWTSACLLARTNAYGVHVQISMRAPDDAPQAVKDALATTQDERTQFFMREGTYYGNIFGMGAVGSPVELFACAGPESNVPQITQRFCSSQGDNGPIDVVGACLPAGADPGSCDDEDTDPASSTFGGIRQCTGHDGVGLFPQTITVFLKQPLAVCGNNVCEDAQEQTDCVSDCHPGTWGTSTPSYIGASAVAHGATDTIVRATITDQAVDFGGGHVEAATGNWDVVVARFTQDGAYLASNRVAVSGLGPSLYVDPTVTVAPSGAIYVVGARSLDADDLVVVKLSSNLTLAPGWPKFYGGVHPSPSVFGTRSMVSNHVSQGAQMNTMTLATDAADNLYVSGVYDDKVEFGLTQLDAGSASEHDAFLVKLTAGGSVVWARSLETPVYQQHTVFVDGASVWLTVGFQAVEYSASSGVIQFQKQISGAIFGEITRDAAGHYYVTGSYSDGTDFGSGPLPSPVDETLYVLSYEADFTTVRWIYAAPTADCETATSCRVNYEGYRIGFDEVGNVVVGAMGGSADGGTIDLGAGPFEGYGTLDVFVGAVTADTGQSVWAKHVPLVLDGVLQNLSFASDATIVISGVFAGSMLADGVLLVSSIPEDVDHFDGYIASFRAPVPDTVAPIIEHLPENITLAAWPDPLGTRGPGAIGTYQRPVAVDANWGGTNVHCKPSPHAWLNIGPHVITCDAWDAFGNHTANSFTITVKDLAGPKFSAHPNITSPSTVVNYTPPAATDAIDGARPVTCLPASGSTFPLGNTTVSCTASDLHGNSATSTFVVTVTDDKPPVVSVPNDITVEAKGPNGTIVSFTATATDPEDGPIVPKCQPKSGSMFPLGKTKVVCVAVDSAGNKGTNGFWIRVVDTTPPALKLPTTITVAATKATGANVSYGATANDIVDGSVPVSCTPASGALFPLGTTLVHCSASDSRGNTRNGTFTVRVIVSWSGILQPVNNDDSSVFKVGSTVQLRFNLTGASANITNLLTRLQVTKISNTVQGTVLEQFSNATPDTGDKFHYVLNPAAGFYLFNLGTQGLTKGTYLARIEMYDGESRTVLFSLL